MIELNAVTKQYLYGARLFGALDLRIDDGETLGVLGKRGSGKTTLLKTIVGATESEGEILFDGVAAKSKRDDTIVLFDDGALFKRRSVRYNIGYPLTVRKVDKKDIETAVQNAAKELEIDNLLSKRVGTLSAREQRRVSAARLFVRDAKYLFVDDYSSWATKPDERREEWRFFREKLKKLHYLGKTVVYTTPFADELMGVADRIAILHDGDVKQVGRFRDIIAHPDNIWAAEALCEDYVFDTATLVDDGTLKLKFQDKGFTLEIEELRGRVLEEYIGKEVYVGKNGSWRRMDDNPITLFDRTNENSILK